MSAVLDHSECAAAFRAKYARKFGWDVHATELPPLVDGPFTGEPIPCGHEADGRALVLWVEPTGVQLMKWAAAKEGRHG